MGRLLDLFQDHKQSRMQKFLHHIHIYDKLFLMFKDPTVLEIGVAQGGSLQLWKNYFGRGARVAGIDVQGSFDHLSQDNIEVFIGSQDDPKFLKEVGDKLGKIDILIDDGGHDCLAQAVTFETLFPYISDGGLYVCEDIHTSYRFTHHGGYKLETSFVEYIKDLVDSMHYKEFGDNSPPTPYGLKLLGLVKEIKSISFYRQMIVIRKNLKADEVFSPLIRGGE